MSIFQEYADLRSQIEVLQTALKEKETACISQLKETKQKSAKTEIGTFSIVERKSIKYTDELVNKEKELNRKVDGEIATIKITYENDYRSLEIAKENEVSQGKAEIKIAESFRFQAVKYYVLLQLPRINQTKNPTHPP